jgi:hypothetical protein
MRSAMLKPCDVEIPNVTSLLTLASLSIASASGCTRFLSSMMVTGFSVPSSATDIATERPRVSPWIVASMAERVTPVHDYAILDSAYDASRIRIRRYCQCTRSGAHYIHRSFCAIHRSFCAP